MTTVRDLLSDIKATLGLGIDDAEWSDGSIVYNIGMAVDLLKHQELARQMRANDQERNMTHVSTFTVPLLTDPAYERRYFAMPGPVYNLPNNGGIEYIAYFRLGLPPNCPPQVARVQYSPTSWRELPMLYADPIQAPSPERPRYIRTPTVTWLFGQDTQIATIEVGLYLSFSPITTIDIDADLDISPDMLFNVRRMVLQQGNWLMLQPHERLLNDGRANNVGQPPRPTPPIMSVNDPATTTPSL